MKETFLIGFRHALACQDILHQDTTSGGPTEWKGAWRKTSIKVMRSEGQTADAVAIQPCCMATCTSQESCGVLFISTGNRDSKTVRNVRAPPANLL